ncbi:MAG: AMP-binding protein, partial [Burkholderiaceae bacterium]|nr:AMP-binding protein [Burkholderiaceae bacterium]
FCAAVVADRVNLLPPSRAPQAMARLAARYPSLVCVADPGAVIEALPPPLAVPAAPAQTALWPPPTAPRGRVAAIAFTSGSTGEPMPQRKYWGGVVDGARAEVRALGLAGQGPGAHDDTVLVGTVSAQHMYGLESTVLMALHGPFAFAAEHPLHPEQVVDVLAQQSGRRVLVTTPVHLRALIASGASLPPLARVVSATAPLPDDLAQRCEAAWQARVLEVYGCTETGMLATRRTLDGPAWTLLDGVTLAPRALPRQADADGDAEGAPTQFTGQGGHVVVPGPIADHLRPLDARRFLLDGRLLDVVNIGGRRASLAALSLALQQLPGVRDGAFVMPDAVDGREARLMALAVAPGITRAQVLAALRSRIDAVFLPRPLLLVEALPRNPQGKLPRAELLALAAAEQARLRARAARPSAAPARRVA